METTQRNQRQHDGLRTLDHHESWRDVYALLEVEPSIETNTINEPDQRSASLDDTAATVLEVRA